MALTLRHKLILLYFLTVSVPLVVLILILPYYYENLFNRYTTELYEGTLTSLTSNVEMYLDELERLTIMPYFNNDVMAAMKLKASNQFGEASEYAKHMAERSLGFALPNQLRSTRQEILGTILVLADGSVYISNNTNLSAAPVPGFPHEEQEWYRKAVERDGRVAYISSHPQDYFGSDRQVFSVARLLKDPDTGKPLGVIMADAESIVLENILRNARFNVTTIAAILDENKRPLYASRPLDDAMIAQLAAGAETVAGPDDTYRAVVKTMPESGWSIAVLFSNREFQSKLTVIYRIGALFAAGGILLTLMLNVSLTRWIVRPFSEMVRVMQKVKRGDLNQRVAVRGKDEIAQLGAALNMMIAKLKDMIDREYRAELGKREAEFRALQSQIQPHFLYNTLNGLIGLNRSGQHKLLENAIFSLSGMLRYTLDHEDETTLAQEMAFLKQYCELQKLRFGDRLEYALEFEPGLAECRLPKLVLQPLVENAIIHGIEPLAERGRLTVRAELRTAGFDPSSGLDRDRPGQFGRDRSFSGEIGQGDRSGHVRSVRDFSGVFVHDRDRSGEFGPDRGSSGGFGQSDRPGHFGSACGFSGQSGPDRALSGDSGQSDRSGEIGPDRGSSGGFGQSDRSGEIGHDRALSGDFGDGRDFSGDFGESRGPFGDCPPQRTGRQGTGTGEPWLYIRIEDNGVGFDGDAGEGSVGIANVRERLALFDRRARLELRSAAGKGTVAELWIPAREGFAA